MMMITVLAYNLWNRIEEPSNKATYLQLVFQKGSKNTLEKMVLEKLDLHHETQTGPLETKANPKCINNFHVTPSSMKPLQENCMTLIWTKTFLDMTPKTQATKAKN